MAFGKGIDAVNLLPRAESMEGFLLPPPNIEITGAGDKRVDARAIKKHVVAAQGGQYVDERGLTRHHPWEYLLGGYIQPNFGGASTGSVLAERLARAGLASEVVVYLRDGALGGRFTCPADNPRA